MSRLRNSRLPGDLFRDLRDRRLLIPVAALLVALVAVPLVLGGGSPPAAPPPAGADPAGEATAVEPAVLAEASGVRNYRKRLSALKQKNPFEQKFSLPSPRDVALQDSPPESAPASTPSDSTGSASTSSDSSTVDQGTSSSPGEPTATAPEAGSTSPETTEPVPPAQPEPEIRFYSSRVDVTIGPLGQAERLDGVKPLDLLPDAKTPVVAFLGLSSADEAVFSVSRDVTASDGEGSCSPEPPSPCEFLVLAVGEQRMLTYGTEGPVYRLALLGTDVVRVPDPRERQPQAEDSDSQPGDSEPQTGAPQANEPPPDGAKLAG